MYPIVQILSNAIRWYNDTPYIQRETYDYIRVERGDCILDGATGQKFTVVNIVKLSHKDMLRYVLKVGHDLLEYR